MYVVFRIFSYIYPSSLGPIVPHPSPIIPHPASPIPRPSALVPHYHTHPSSLIHYPYSLPLTPYSSSFHIHYSPFIPYPSCFQKVPVKTQNFCWDFYGNLPYDFIFAKLCEVQNNCVQILRSAKF